MMRGKIKIGNSYYGLTERGITVLIILIAFIGIIVFISTQPRKVETIYKQVENSLQIFTMPEPKQPNV